MSIGSKGIIVAFLILLMANSHSSVQGQEPVVHGVFFYSQTCPHCQHFIEESYPWYQQEFGDQLQLVFINTHTNEGRELLISAIELLVIARERWAVPRLRSITTGRASTSFAMGVASSPRAISNH